MMTDDILATVDLNLEPACESAECPNPAELSIRFACGCHVLACNPCRALDKAHTNLLEARHNKTEIGLAWWCPICETPQMALFPDAYRQMITSVVPL